MAGDDLRRTFCCDLGILIAEYQLEAHDWSDFGKGGYDYWAGWWEYIALFRLVGGMEGSDQAFDTAEEIYVDYGDPEFIPEDFQVKYESFIISVAESAGYDIEEYALKFWAETHPPLESTTFTEWIDFLREHVPEFIEMVDQQGEWVDDVGPDSEETEEDS